MDIREKILEIISDELYAPMSANELFDIVCGDDTHAVKEFFKTVCNMEQSLEIFVSKKGKISLPPRDMFIRGIFTSGTHGKFGFVTNDGGEWFVPGALVCSAMHGDSVVAKRLTRASRYYAKGNEVEIVAITERAVVEFTGEFEGFYSKGKLFGIVHPDSERLDFVGTVAGSAIKAETGDKVVCKITKYPLYEGDKVGVKVIEALGKSDSREANYRAILRDHRIPLCFDSAVLDEAEAVCEEPIVPQGRVDFRNKRIFTIDSESAKDLDDAISIEVREDSYVLGVHIADVSHYVREGTALDREAMARGTSVYFTDKVVPMLPPALSNGACSLNGGVDRYALSCIITLDKSGSIINTEICESIIRSCVRGVYSELNDIIDNGESSAFYPKYRHIAGDFAKMMELYEILRLKAERNGAMELEGDEVEIILDSDGHPVDIKKRERGQSERLIEQFMLCANRAVAELMHKHSLPCVYRVHENPDPEKIQAFSFFAQGLGLDVSSLRDSESVTPLALASVLQSAKELGCAEAVSGVLLRSLMKAKYTSTPSAHFGLATKLYCHFTSPIRRYPDLSVHRILKIFLHSRLDKSELSRLAKFAEKSGRESSENELRALYAEREIDELYKTVYMADRIGEEMDGTICSVTSFGFFVKCENHCEGLVPLSSLDHGFFFDEARLTLCSTRGAFVLGQRVRVRVAQASIITRRVTLELIEAELVKSETGTAFNTPKKAFKKSRTQRESKKAPKHIQKRRKIPSKHTRKKRRR